MSSDYAFRSAEAAWLEPPEEKLAPCRACNGTGRRGPDDGCEVCEGSGEVVLTIEDMDDDEDRAYEEMRDRRWEED
jgi:hypothetical protein